MVKIVSFHDILLHSPNFILFFHSYHHYLFTDEELVHHPEKDFNYRVNMIFFQDEEDTFNIYNTYPFNE